MTEQERERAEVEGQALADVVTEKIRGEIWKASATWSAIAAFILLCCYRSDFAVLRAEIRSIKAGPAAMQQQQVTFKGADSEAELRHQRILHILAQGKSNAANLHGHPDRLHTGQSRDHEQGSGDHGSAGDGDGGRGGIRRSECNADDLAERSDGASDDEGLSGK